MNLRNLFAALLACSIHFPTMAQSPIIVAHRGFSHVAPENTLAAFEAAVEAGAPYFELDVQRSADGVPLVIHDETLDKTSSHGHTGRLDERNAEDLVKEAVGYPAKFGAAFATEMLPTLEEALTLARGRIRVCVEIKVAGIEEAIVRAIRSTAMENDVIVFSFLPEVLSEVHALAPNLPLLFLKEDATTDDLQRAVQLHATAIGVGGKSRIDAAFVEAADRLGLEVWCWTVDDPNEMRRLADIPVRAIITNRPDIGLEVVR